MLLREGATAPKMLGIGLHLRLIGRPARLRGLEQLLEHVRRHQDAVWVTRRIDLARHWRALNGLG
jgi:peptidoglycan/xylan/chitin deacetylase (PgdA/CDA1 family)